LNECREEVYDVQSKAAVDAALVAKEIIEDNGCIEHDCIDTRELLEGLE